MPYRGIHTALRSLRSAGLPVWTDTAPLERQRTHEQPPHLEAATPIEGAHLEVRRVEGEPVVGFGAFLDGIQRTRVIAYAPVTGVPIIHGVAAAAVRVREGKRMRTWDRPLLTDAIYAPLHAYGFSLQPEDLAFALVASDVAPGSHPQEYLTWAVSSVQRTRERAEVALAEVYVAGDRPPLLIDGGISGSGKAARHPRAVGVVKSHNTLYVAGDSLATVLGLREGERTTAVELTSPRRVPVATWYLRLRDHGDRSPFFGLVRVEVAREGEITARADLVSRWLLAERIPVSLPDPRWDVMVYGIRECEQYLASIIT